MDELKKKVASFLTQHGMYHGDVDIDQTCSAFLDEMAKGLAGTDSSLAMLPTYIETEQQLPRNKPVIVMDAGGTNFRVATVCFKDDGQAEIADFQVQSMPGIKAEASKKEFFGTMAGYAKDVLGKSDSVGFCFSYPIEMSPNKDGRVLYFSKEIKAEEVVGKMIGRGLNEAIVETTGTAEKRMVLLNDTVATLLTGKAFGGTRDWGGHVGFILGTGTNTCYVESNSVIGKAPGLDPAHYQVINCESGNFAVHDRGEADRMLGEQTAKPETFWLEKMLSGGYFGALATQLIRLACRQGILGDRFAGRLDDLGEVSTKDADNYAHNPDDGADNALVAAMQASGSSDDAERLWFLMDALLERAARLTAANLAASVLKGRSADGALRPTCLTIDGTTYYRYYRFQSRVEHHLRPFLTQRNKYYETVRVEDAPLIGAAVAALTNP